MHATTEDGQPPTFTDSGYPDDPPEACTKQSLTVVRFLGIDEANPCDGFTGYGLTAVTLEMNWDGSRWLEVGRRPRRFVPASDGRDQLLRSFYESYDLKQSAAVYGLHTKGQLLRVYNKLLRRYEGPPSVTRGKEAELAKKTVDIVDMVNSPAVLTYEARSSFNVMDTAEELGVPTEKRDPLDLMVEIVKLWL